MLVLKTDKGFPNGYQNVNVLYAGGGVFGVGASPTPNARPPCDGGHVSNKPADYALTDKSGRTQHWCSMCFPLSVHSKYIATGYTVTTL
jgi:hypothetical protein